MKKILLLALIPLFLTSCIPSYYEMKTAEHKAHGLAAAAYNSRIETKLVEIDPETGVITVYNQNQARPIMPQKQRNPFVEFMDVTLNSTVAKIMGGGWAAGYVAGKAQGHYTNSGSGSIEVTRDSHNPIAVKTADEGGTIKEGSDNDQSTQEHLAQSDMYNTDLRSDDHSQSSTETVMQSDMHNDKSVTNEHYVYDSRQNYNNQPTENNYPPSDLGPGPVPVY